MFYHHMYVSRFTYSSKYTFGSVGRKQREASALHKVPPHSQQTGFRVCDFFCLVVFANRAAITLEIRESRHTRFARAALPNSRQSIYGLQTKTKTPEHNNPTSTTPHGRNAQRTKETETESYIILHNCMPCNDPSQFTAGIRLNDGLS